MSYIAQNTDAENNMFTLVKERETTDGHWCRYDGYNGRFSVCISTAQSGYRYIQIFTHRDTDNEAANLYAPNMFPVVHDITTVDVSLEMTYDTRRYSDVEQGKAWEQVKREMDIGFKAAAEIKRRFVDPYLAG